MEKKNIFKALIFVIITLTLDAISLFLMANRGEAFNLNIGFLNGALFLVVLSTLIKDFKGQKHYRDFISTIYYILATVLNFCFILFKLSNLAVGIWINVIVLVIFLIFYLAVMAKVNKDGEGKMF